MNNGRRVCVHIAPTSCPEDLTILVS